MPVQAQRGGGGIVPAYSQPSTRGRWVVSTILRTHYSGKDQVPIVQEAGWALGLLWMAQKISPPLGFNPQTIQPVARCNNNCTILAAQDFIVVR